MYREPALLIGLHADHHLASHSLPLSAHASLPQGLSLQLQVGDGGGHVAAPTSLTHGQPSEHLPPAPLSPKPELFSDDRLPDSDATSSQDQAAAKKRRRPSGASGDGKPVYPVAQEFKACAQCRIIKPASEFHRNRSKPCGLGSWCKDCMTKWYSERPAHTPSVTEKQCTGCKKVKPASEFHRQSRLPTGLRIYCKGCEHLRHKQKPKVEEPQVAEAACTRCQAVKPASEFPRKRNSPTGLHALCKDCHTATHPPKPKPEGQAPAKRCSRCGGERGSRPGRADGGGGKEKGTPASWCKACASAAATAGEGGAAAGMGTKACGKCAEVKPQVAFFKDLSSADGLGSWCQQCIQASLKERLAATGGVLQSKPAAVRKKPPRANPPAGGATSSSSSASSKPLKLNHPQPPPPRVPHHAPQPVISGLPAGTLPTPYTSILPAPATTSFSNPLRIRPPPVTTPAPPNPAPFSSSPVPSRLTTATSRTLPPHSRPPPTHPDHPSQLLSHLSLPFSYSQPPDNLLPLPDLGDFFPDFTADDTLMDLPSYLPPSTASLFSHPLPTALSLPPLPPPSPTPSPFAAAADPPPHPHSPTSEPDSETTHSDMDPTPPGSIPPWHLDALDPLPSRMPSLTSGLPRLGSAASQDLGDLPPLTTLPPLAHATSQELQAAVEAVTANTPLPPLAPDDFPYTDTMDLLHKQ